MPGRGDKRADVTPQHDEQAEGSRVCVLRLELLPGGVTSELRPEGWEVGVKLTREGGSCRVPATVRPVGMWAVWGQVG